MARVSILTVEGDRVTVRDMQAESVMQMLEALESPDVHVLPISLDGEAMTYIVKSNVVRIDVD